MPGTLLASDWQSSVEDELHRHVQDTMAAATQAAAAIPTLSVPQISAPSVDPQAVLNELNQHVQGIVANATQAVQPAVQQVQQLGSVGDQLQAHVQTVLGANNGGPFTPLAQPQQQQDQTTLGGGQPTITTLGGGSNAPVAPLGAPPAAAADVLGGPPSSDTTTAGTADRSMSYQDYAKAAAKRAGIDPNVFTAQIQQESGFNPTARSPAGAIGIAQFMPETAKSAGIDPTDAYASLDAAAAEDAKRLKQYEGDWGKTLASYNAGAGAVAQYNGIPPYAETQTYVKTIMGNAQKAADAAGTTISNTVAPGPSVPTTAPVTTAQARAADLGYKDVSQFGDKQLTPAEAYAACGPAAAVRFAERMGRQPTLREATDLAASVGWTAQSGMAGISSEQSLMTKLGVPTKLVQGDQWDVFAKEAQTGNPVTISTPGHYFFADAYNPDTGAFHVGQSGKDLRQGSEWMTPAQMESLMGKAQGALFADSPVTPVQSSAAGTTPTAPVALGGTTGTAPAPINVPGQEAKPPIVMGQNQPVTPLGGDSQRQGLTPIQTAEDSVAGVIGDIKRAGQQAVATLGGAADQAGQAAGQTIRTVASDLGSSRAADIALRSGRTQAEEDQLGQQQLGAAQQIAQQNQPGAATQPPTLGEVGSSVVNLLTGANPGQGITLGDYTSSQQAKNQWIEQNNPARDVLVLGGLTTGIAQQLTDPAMLVAFGPTTSMGRAAGARVGEAVSGALTDRLAPRVVQGVQTVAERLTSGGLANGLQMAIVEAEKPDATPLSVGQGFLQGAALGGVIDAGAPAAKAVIGRIGQQILDRAPDIRPALGDFLRSETGAAGRPGDVAAVRAEQETPTPGATRMFHGTGTGFETPTGEHFDPNGLYGPGYYLTSDPRVAGGVVRDADVTPQPGDVESVWGKVLDPATNPDLQRGAVVRYGYAQNADPALALQQTLAGYEQRQAAGGMSDRMTYMVDQQIERLRGEIARTPTPSSGPNVRAVDVPQSLRLLNVDAPVTGADVQRVGDAITKQTGDPIDARSFVVNVRSQNPQGVSGETLHTALRSYLDTARPGATAAENLRATNTILSSAGYDGISYNGGQRIPMNDAAGAPIEHQATVVFPESLSKIRNAISGRQGGQTQLPFGINVAGGVAGGYAGNLATPQDAPPEERLRNIGLGATAGLLGTRGITAALERSRLAPEAARAASEGFRAPEPTARPGENLLRATTEEPTGAVPQRGEVVGAEPAVPQARTLSEVHSNPHLLNAARPGETPMTDDELGVHYDQLDTRRQAVEDRLAAIDEQLRNPNAKPERPPWGAGWTNDQLVQIAHKHDVSAYEPLWWEKAGLDVGSGEVRENVGEGGFRNPNATRESTPAELRAERNTLALEQRDIQAAGDQLGNATPGQRFVRRESTTADLPDDSGLHGPNATEQPGAPPGTLANDIVTRNGTKDYGNPLQEGPGQVIGTRGEVTGRGISDAEAAHVGEPSAQTKLLMPNLDALLKDEMPEVRAQIQKAGEDNPQLMAAYQQGRISRDSVMTDLANKVGMSKADWLKTKVGQGFSTPELAALQAAVIDAQEQSKQLAGDISARGGVDALTPEEVAHSLTTLVDNARLLAVGRGGRSSAGRSLNILKERLSATMAQGINASNERIAALRVKSQAKAAANRATKQLEQAKNLDAEQKTAVARAQASGAPKNIIDQIADAYDQLDRYQAMTLHEKADDFNALKKARDEAAAKRTAAVREPPQELLSALQAELKAERDNFAKRKDTWETMAFWDSKANENVATKRRAFRGGLYIEQYRRSAELAAKQADQQATRAFDLETRRKTVQRDKASALLEAVGGQKPSRELLANYVEAINNDDPMVAAKFIKGLQEPGIWGRATIVRIAGLLSSTATHMVNSVGNLTQVPLELATHAATVPIDWGRSKITGGERQAYMEELGPMAGAWGGGFLSALPDALKILKTGVSPQDATDIARGKVGRPGFASGSGKLDAAVEMPLRALQAEDQLFRGGAFAMQAKRVATNFAKGEGFAGKQLEGRANDIIANLESYPDLYTQAESATRRMLFQERRTMPLVDRIPTKGVPGEIAQGAISQVLPFVKTPGNITAQGFGLSPFGAAGVLEGLANRRNLRPEQLGQQTLLTEQRAARTAIGTAIMGGFMALGYGAFTNGKSMLTGAYDPEEASTYPQGYREWSMATSDPVTGNTYYIPFQNFGAAGAPMAMAAILTDAHRRGQTLVDGNEAVRASTAIGQYILDNTFLQGLSDTVNVLHDPTQYAPKFVESLVSSYGPYSAMGRQIQRAMGVASRNPREGFQSLVDAMASNYPGASSTVPESTTPLGEPRTQGISGAAAFALPIRADISRDEPTLAALRAADVRIPAAAKAVNVGNGWSIDLSEDEQDQVKRARGAGIRDQVAAVQTTDLYKNGDVSTRNQLLSKAISNAAQNADVGFIRSLSQAELQKRAVRKAVPTPYTIAEAS